MGSEKNRRTEEEEEETRGGGGVGGSGFRKRRREKMIMSMNLEKRGKKREREDQRRRGSRQGDWGKAILFLHQPRLAGEQWQTNRCLFLQKQQTESISVYLQPGTRKFG